MDKLMKAYFRNQDEKSNTLYYQAIVDGLNLAMWKWDVSKQQIIPLFGLDTLLGYTEHELIDQPNYWINQWHPEDRQAIKQLFRNCHIEKCKEFEVINRILHKNGHYLWFYTKASVVYDQQGYPTYTAVSINIDNLQAQLEDLHLEKESYQNFLYATNAATWMWNIQTGETEFDDRWAHLLGFTLEELAPISLDTWKRLTHPEDLAQTMLILQDVMEKKQEYYNATFRMKHKQGYDVWINDRGKIITWTQDGKPLLMVGTHIDITEQKKLEADLIRSETHFKQLVENSFDIIYAFDSKGIITYLSPSWEKWLGFAVDEAIMHSYRDFIHPDDIHRIETLFEDVLRKDTRLSIDEYRLLTKKGDYRWYNTSATLLKNEYGEFVGIIGTARDITRRKEMQATLSYERDLFRTTLMSVADAVISTDQHGHVVLINPIAESILGYKANEVKDHQLCEYMRIYFEDHDKGQACSIESLLHVSKQTFISQATLLNRKEKPITIELSVAPIQDAKDSQQGVVIIFRDISDKIRKQKEIEFLSFHDYLTGLYNRRYMDQSVIDLDKDRYLPLGTMILDVNDLKEMNDQFGHQSGDEMLKKVSRILEQTISPKDVLGRIGGDEFLILSPNSSDEAMYELKHQLMNIFEKENLKGQPISVAIGYSVKNDAEQNIYEVMRVADDFMYAHKEARIKQKNEQR